MESPSATRGHRSPNPFIRVLPSVALAIVTSGSVAGAQVDPSAEPTADVRTVHGWPGAEDAPAGLYSWSVSDTGGTWARRRWMHKIPETGGVTDSVELTFFAGTLRDRPAIESHAVWRAWGLEDDRFDQPTRVGNDVRTEMWLLDVEGTRVAILLDSFPETDPALLAEARAVIESIVVEPAGDEGQARLVFRLEQGWDSG